MKKAILALLAAAMMLAGGFLYYRMQASLLPLDGPGMERTPDLVQCSYGDRFAGGELFLEKQGEQYVLDGKLLCSDGCFYTVDEQTVDLERVYELQDLVMNAQMDEEGRAVFLLQLQKKGESLNVLEQDRQTAVKLNRFFEELAKRYGTPVNMREELMGVSMAQTSSLAEQCYSMELRRRENTVTFGSEDSSGEKHHLTLNEDAMKPLYAILTKDVLQKIAEDYRSNCFEEEKEETAQDEDTLSMILFFHEIQIRIPVQEEIRKYLLAIAEEKS